MNLHLHPVDQPTPQGMRPFVSLELGDRPVDAPSRIANASTPIPLAGIIGNIEVNSRRGFPLLGAQVGLKSRPLVIACFGPSLADTWRGIGDEGGDILTCSGAHSFLWERGIVPDMHTECDPRAHKAHFLSLPHPATRFLLASRVHPSMVDHVQGLNTTLFHMAIDSEVPTCLAVSPGAALVPVGTTNGMSAITLGIFLGYRDFRIYGMDGSFRSRDEHAGFHPNPNEAPHSIVEVEGRKFETSMLHLLALQDFFTIALSNPGTSFEFRGDGMLPWAVSESKRKWREAQ